MRSIGLLVGNLLLALGLAGLVIAPGAYALTHRASVAGVTTALQALPQLAAPPREVPAVAPVDDAPAATSTSPVTADAPPPDPAHTITAVRIPRINLQAEGALARLVQMNGGTTWEVPAYKAGHGEYTTGAGQPGNAVLMGHVSSVNAGNVFRDLDRVRPGDAVQVDSAAGSFTYRVTQVLVVPRTDLSVVQPTETPTLSLITCAGAWLPQLNEFAERLVVRAALVEPGAIA